MSITRVGLSESQRFAAGYEAIFGGRRSTSRQPAKAKTKKKSAPAPRKKKPAKKKR